MRSTLGYHLTPLGLYKDEAASCRFTSANFQRHLEVTHKGQAGRGRRYSFSAFNVAIFRSIDSLDLPCQTYV